MESKRPVSEGAERWLEVAIPCLNHGFVRLVDYMGNDGAVVQAARVSYGQGTKSVNEDNGLIRYLRRHAHTTPFEMIELKFHVKLPIFVARQWIRHRTANVNEYSGRYSEMLDEFFVPDASTLGKQSKGNKQGRSESLSEEQAEFVLKTLKEDSRRSYDHYKEFLDMGLARELARISLSLANYTQWYWKIDLHNLFHFLKLRLDPHAQYEIRIFGEAIAKIVKDAFPICFGAFEDYQLLSMWLSHLEVGFVQSHPNSVSEAEARPLLLKNFGENKRETDEAVEKLKLLGRIV